MAFENFVPTYFIVTLFISYLIWAKLLNKNNEESIKPKVADDLISIILIFFIITGILTFGISIYVLIIVLISLNPSMDLNSLFTFFKIEFVLYSLFLLINFISIEKYSKQKLMNIISYSYYMLLCFFIILIVISVIRFYFVSPLSRMFLLKTPALPFLIPIFISIFLIFLIPKLLKNSKISKGTNFKITKGRKRKYIVIIILMSVIFFLIMPQAYFKFSYEEPITKTYEIFDIPNYDSLEGYSFNEYHFPISRFGVIYKLFKINLDENLELSNSNGINLNLYMNNSGKESLLLNYDTLQNNNFEKKYNFTKVEFYPEYNEIYLWHLGKKYLKESKISGFIIEGYKKINLTGKFEYDIPREIVWIDEKEELGLIKINISNKINSSLEEGSIHLNNIRLASLGWYGKEEENCRIKSIEIDSKNETNEYSIKEFKDCNSKSCDADKSEKYRIDFYIDDPYKIYMRGNIHQKIDLYMVVKI